MKGKGLATSRAVCARAVAIKQSINSSWSCISSMQSTAITDIAAGSIELYTSCAKSIPIRPFVRLSVFIIYGRVRTSTYAAAPSFEMHLRRIYAFDIRTGIRKLQIDACGRSAAWRPVARHETVSCLILSSLRCLRSWPPAENPGFFAPSFGTSCGF